MRSKRSGVVRGTRDRSAKNKDSSKAMLTLTALLPAIGALVLAKEALSLLAVLFRTVLRPAKDPRKFGKWAIVTGATDGIGKAFAFQLAKKKMSVLLISRSPDKLAHVAEELRDQHPDIDVAVEAVDFADLTPSRLEELKAVIDELDIGLLVNNVGMSYPFAQWFDELTDAEVESLLRLNVESTTWMTRLVLPGMIARKRGAVVNQSSAAARFSLPLLAQYSAAKGYIENFTRSLASEYASKNLHFQCQSPFWVSTAMTFPGSRVAVDKRATLATPTARTYAKYAVRAIGYEVFTSPYPIHEIAVWVLSRIPSFILDAQILSMHKGVRFHKKNVEKMSEKKGKKVKST